MDKPSRLLLIILIVGIIISIGYTIFRFYTPSLGFAYFEPAYLPPGVSIKDKRILVRTYKGGEPKADLNFGTENWIYSINEYKADEGATIGTADGKYDATSVKPTCQIITSPEHQRYRLCHWIDYGRINVYEVRFIKGETYIVSRMPSKLDKTITVQQITKYVDSFERKTSIGIPARYSSGA